jgi:hypothetical protein
MTLGSGRALPTLQNVRSAPYHMVTDDLLARRFWKSLDTLCHSDPCHVEAQNSCVRASDC